MPRTPPPSPFPTDLPRGWARATALALLAAAVAAAPVEASGARKTVCTITVNSPDEKDALARALPADQYDFVELVEHGRPDWLAGACRRQIACDVLVVSGHYDGEVGGHEFFPDSLDKREYLAVDELERASCSASCGTLFRNLKEVYLFGCNTLNPEARRSVTAGAETSRDRMRLVFHDVPAVYGFSSTAPLGPVAAQNLRRYLAAGGAREFGSGRRSAALLAQFPGGSLTATSGVRAGEPLAAQREDVCQFNGDTTTAERIAFVADVLRRDGDGLVRVLDRVEHALDDAAAAKGDDGVDDAFAHIAADDALREAFLQRAPGIADLPLRLRLLTIAQRLGWLEDAAWRDAVLAAARARVAGRRIDPPDVDALCRANARHELDGPATRLGAVDDAASAALAACLGDPSAHMQMLRALTGENPAAAGLAAVYFAHRPLVDPAELREVAAGITTMRDTAGQARALRVIAAAPPDPSTLAVFTDLYRSARTADAQNAIAVRLLRFDTPADERVSLAQDLREHRRDPHARDLVGVLIRRLEASALD